MTRRGAPLTLLAISAVLISAVLVLGAAGCGSPHHTANPAAPQAGSSVLPSLSVPPNDPVAPPSAGASPSASGKARPTPSKSGPTTPPPAGQPPFVLRPPGTGSGPDGSISRTDSNAIALTFDDGPDPVNTPAILKVLRDNGVKATFCLVGSRVRDHPEIVRQIVADGHTLCNHSWQHLIDLAERPPSYIHWDLEQTNQAIHNAVPDAQVKYFRAPGGNFTPDLITLARGYGMEPLFWDVDPKDWDHSHDKSDTAHVARVIAEVERQVRQGSIILSHDNKQPDSIVAYQTLIPWLKQHFTLVALPT